MATKSTYNPLTGKTDVTQVPDTIPTGPVYNTQTRQFAPQSSYVAPPAPIQPVINTKAPVSVAYSDTGGDSQEIRDARASKLIYDKQQSETIVDEPTLRAQTLANFQAEIDAQNKVYGDILARAKVQGQGRIGTTTAVNARSGTLGSDFGNAATDRVSAVNEEIYGSIDNERNAAISAIMTKARDSGTKAIADAREAKTKGLDSYLKNLTDQAAQKPINAKLAAKNLLTAGIAPDQVNPQYLEEVAKQYGVTIDEIRNGYIEAKKEQDQANVELAAKNEKAAADLAGTKASTAKAIADTAQISKKFEEDKRQWGLDYALRARETAAKELDAETRKAESDAKNPLKAVNTSISERRNHLDFLKETVDSASKISTAAGPGGIERFLGDTFKGDTDFRQLEQYVDTLRTNLLSLATDPDIKKFFGPQMTNADVRLMQSTVTILNPQGKPIVFKEELVRIRDLFDRIQKSLPSDSNVLPVSDKPPAEMTNAEIDAAIKAKQ